MAREHFTIDYDSIRVEYRLMAPAQRKGALVDLSSQVFENTPSGDVAQDSYWEEKALREGLQRIRILEQMIKQDERQNPPLSGVLPQTSIVSVFHAAFYEEPDSAWGVFNMLPRIIRDTLPSNAERIVGRIKENLKEHAAKDCEPIRQKLALDSYELVRLWHYQEIKGNPDNAKEQICERVNILSPAQLLERMRVLHALITEKEFTSVFSGKDFEGFNTMREEMEFELELVQKRLDSTKPIHEIPALKVA